MKIKGVVRQLDPVGRVVIPVEFRNIMGIKPGDPIEIVLQGSEVVLRKYNESCALCGSTRGLKEYKGKLICSRCAREISKLL